jgi:hypothetical protein
MIESLRSMLWLIARPGAGCRHGDELVALGGEQGMGRLQTTVAGLIRDGEESVRSERCLCDADASAVLLERLLLVPKKKGLKN